MKPGEFLKSIMGERVRVRLNDGSDFVGRLVCLDGFMNIALQEAHELPNGQSSGHMYGTAFLRGNNVFHISRVLAD